jgi:hypothetical protein
VRTIGESDQSIRKRESDRAVTGNNNRRIRQSIDIEEYPPERKNTRISLLEKPESKQEATKKKNQPINYSKDTVK